MNQERYIKHEDILDLRELLYVIKRRIILVIIIPIIFTGIATINSIFVSKPIYQAGVSIIINKNEEGILTQSDVSMYQNLAKTYIEIARSTMVSERAIRDGQIDTSVAALHSSLTVSCQEGTQVLYMSVISGEANDAVIKVEALAQAFIDESKRLLPAGKVEIIDHAQVPQSAINDNKIRNIVRTFALALLFSIVIAFIIEFMNDTIKSEEDVERYFGVPILGVIPKKI